MPVANRDTPETARCPTSGTTIPRSAGFCVSEGVILAGLPTLGTIVPDVGNSQIAGDDSRIGNL